MSTVITANVADAFATYRPTHKSASPKMFKFADGTRMVLYGITSTNRIKFRLYSGGAWGAETGLTGAVGSVAGNSTLGFAAVKVGDVVYLFAPASPNAVVVKLAYAAGVVTQSEYVTQVSGGTQLVYGIHYDSSNNLLHIAYGKNTAPRDQKIEAISTSLVFQYNATVEAALASTPSDGRCGLVGFFESMLVFRKNLADDGFTVHPVMAGPSSYTVGAAEAGPVLTNIASLSAAADADGMFFVGLVNENTGIGQAAHIAITTRDSINAYGGWVDIVSGTRSAFSNDGITICVHCTNQEVYDAYVFFVRRLTNASNFEVCYVRRNNNDWGTPVVLDTSAGGLWEPAFGDDGSTFYLDYAVGGTIQDTTGTPTLSAGAPLNLVEISFLASCSPCAGDPGYATPSALAGVSDAFTGTARTSAPQAGTAEANY